jgi:thrombospondin type 3 repeat protein
MVQSRFHLLQAYAWLGALLAVCIMGQPVDVAAQVPVPDPVVYRLRPDSAFLRGCFGACDCAVEIGEDLRGTFALERVPGSPADPFAVYTVSNLTFLVNLGGQPLRITGSGIYRVGGEFALLHQLTLQLQIGDQASTKFDSGLVPGGGDFPLINIDVSMNGQICFDTVIQIRAEPTPPDDADGDGVSNDIDNCARTFNPDQADRDKDGIGDVCDLCPDYASTNNNDLDHNGIGDVCECGDQTQDGTVNVLDLVGINLAIFGAVQVNPLCDANNDGKCNVQDIVGANQKIFGRPAYCSRYPAPGP